MLVLDQVAKEKQDFNYLKSDILVHDMASERMKVMRDRDITDKVIVQLWESLHSKQSKWRIYHVLSTCEKNIFRSSRGGSSF